jgi:DNA replicative helicase MCM subunit Mcm2 (Cdc46/Mcm family)
MNNHYSTSDDMKMINLAEDLRSFEPTLGSSSLEPITADKVFEFDLGKKGESGFMFMELNPDIVMQLVDGNFWDTLALLQAGGNRASGNSINYYFRIRPYKSFPYSKIDDFASTPPNKMIRFKGIIIGRTHRTPVPVEAFLECPKCGKTQVVASNGMTDIKPRTCACGFKGEGRLSAFKKLKIKEMVICTLDVMEDRNLLEGREIPQIIKVVFKGTMLDEDKLKVSNSLIGKKVEIVGTRQIMKTKQGDYLYLEANNIFPIEDIIVEPEYKREIERFIRESKDPLMTIAKSICYNTYKQDDVKLALLLSCIGLKQEKTFHPNFHIMLIGDSGIAKSNLVLPFVDIVEGANLVSKATASGFVGSIVKDNITGRPQYNAGALVLSNDSILIVEETSHQKDEVQSSLQTAMSNGYISLAQSYSTTGKMDINVTMLFTANPKNGKFNPENLYQAQIDSPAAIVDRIALKCYMPVDDVSSQQDKDEIVHYMAGHKSDLRTLTLDFCKKAVKYLRMQDNPYLSPEILLKALVLFTALEKKMKETYNEYEADAIRDMTHRQKKNFLQLARIHARAMLKKEVDEDDLKKAEEIYFKCEWSKLLKFTGTMNDSLLLTRFKQSESTHFPETESQKIAAVKQIIADSHKAIAIWDIEAKATQLGISHQSVDKAISILKAKGDIFEPKQDMYAAVGRQPHHAEEFVGV